MVNKTNLDSATSKRNTVNRMEAEFKEFGSIRVLSISGPLLQPHEILLLQTREMPSNLQICLQNSSQAERHFNWRILFYECM